MPLERSHCPCCNDREMRCPECGDRKVTPRDNPQQDSPTNIVDLGMEGEEDGIKYIHVCWECGWSEKVTVEITRERV